MLTEQQQLTPRDCLAVLRAAKQDFMAVMAKVFLDKSVTLEMAECSFVVYYLQAVVILKHLQRPGAGVDGTSDGEFRQHHYWCERAQDHHTASCHVCPVTGGGVCKLIRLPLRICQNLFKSRN